jgi:hypothetical protein
MEGRSFVARRSKMWGGPQRFFLAGFAGDNHSYCSSRTQHDVVRHNQKDPCAQAADTDDDLDAAGVRLSDAARSMGPASSDHTCCACSTGSADFTACFCRTGIQAIRFHQHGRLAGKHGNKPIEEAMHVCYHLPERREKGCGAPRIGPLWLKASHEKY